MKVTRSVNNAQLEQTLHVYEKMAVLSSPLTNMRVAIGLMFKS